MEGKTKPVYKVEIYRVTTKIEKDSIRKQELIEIQNIDWDQRVTFIYEKVFEQSEITTDLSAMVKAINGL